MKKIVYLVLIAFTFVNCGTDKKTDKSNTQETEGVSTTVNNSGIEKSKEDKAIGDKTAVFLAESELLNTISKFQDCKAAAIERSDCRNELTTFISKSYGIEDFKDDNGNYMIYDSIQPVVKRSSNWKRLGKATNQEVIYEAVQYTKDGGLALIIDTSDTFGHVVVVQPGKLLKSGSWGIELPVVFSLSNYKPEKSFHDKILAYAFKRSEDIEVFIRK